MAEPTALTGRLEIKPEPWLRKTVLAVAVIGLLIAAYSTIVHYEPGALFCPGATHGPSSCLTVQQSPWSTVAGIPVAVLGLVAYTVIIASLRLPRDLGRSIGFGAALMGFLFSLYLTYREAFSIHQYCEWCLGSAACMTLLVALTAIRLLKPAPVR
jgi:uncharacterized membrane protein